MDFTLAKSDVGYSMFGNMNSQMSMMRNGASSSSSAALHKFDMQNLLNLEKDKFNYQMLDKLDQQQRDVQKHKLDYRA